MMILETKRLILRPWEDKDAEDLYRYASHTAENVPCALENVLQTEHVTCLSQEEWINRKRTK